MTSYKKSLGLLSAHLQSAETEELYLLEHYKKLCVAGMDRKGQISTAYGQSGFGLSLGVAFDFGAMLGPGAHLVTEAKLKGTRTAHALLVLERTPRRVWFEPIRRPPQHSVQGHRYKLHRYPDPDWEAERYFALGFLRGKTHEFEVEASASAWVGFGAAFDVDETGLTAGAKLEGGGSGLRTRLCDNNPGHFAHYNTKSINDDLNGIFKGNTKNRAAAWLVLTIEDFKALLDGDKDETSPENKPSSSAGRKARRLAKTLDDAGVDAANIWDIHDTGIVNRHLGARIGNSVSALHNLGGRVLKAFRGKTLKTEELLADVIKVESLFTSIKAACKEIIKQRDEAAKANGFSDSSAEKGRAQTFIKISRLRLREAKALRKGLERARDLKFFDQAAEKNAQPGVPRFFLDVNMVEGHIATQAAAQFVMPKLHTSEKSYVPRAAVSAGGEAFAKRIGSRYQSYVVGSGSGARTLLNTQDAVVQYTSREMTATGTLNSAQGTKSKQFNLITMSYRAVVANWFDDDGPKAGHALPNGSGISFGMSVLRARLNAYAVKCKALSEQDLILNAGLDDKELDKFEEVMRKQLRLAKKDRPELRKCFRTAPETLLTDDRPDEAFVLESSFAFLKPQKLDIKKHRPQNLFDLRAFASFEADGGGADNENTKLQTIRIRYRKRTDEDHRRGYFSLGWNPTVYEAEEKADGTTQARETIMSFGKSESTKSGPAKLLEKLKEKIGKLKEDGLEVPDMQAQFGLGLERVERVGSEGIVTVHEHHLTPRYSERRYGKDRAEKLEKHNETRNAEILVPPVMLFSQ